jgi:hypothetical protein
VDGGEQRFSRAGAGSDLAILARVQLAEALYAVRTPMDPFDERLVGTLAPLANRLDFRPEFWSHGFILS